jgi:hypothetical protein
MGKIGNIGNLDLKNYCIGFVKCEINIKNYRIKIVPVSPVELIYTDNIKNIHTIQFDTKYRRCYFEIYQNIVVFCFSYWFQMVCLSIVPFCVHFFYQYLCIQNSMKLSISY